MSTTTRAGSGNRLTGIVVWGVVALVGATCWAVLALSRGEDVSALIGEQADAARFLESLRSSALSGEAAQ